MARSDRIQVTVSPMMTVALSILAKRTGLTISTQATVCLRQALARTMESEPAKAALRAHTAQRTHETWMRDTTADRAVENAWWAAQARLADDEKEAASEGECSWADALAVTLEGAE